MDKPKQSINELLAETSELCAILEHKTIVRKYYLHLLKLRLDRLQANVEAAQEIARRMVV